jgi:hypothetical protein
MAVGQLTAVFSYTAAENLYSQVYSGSLTASVAYDLPQKSYGNQAFVSAGEYSRSRSFFSTARNSAADFKATSRTGK